MSEDLIARLREINLDPLCQECADALEARARRIAELSEAIGLLTTLKPDIEIDANSPVNMATQIVAHVDARISELEAENAKFRALYDEQLLMAVKVSAALENTQ